MSKMEKILQNWNTADEYLNSKVEENRLPTFTLEEYERVKDSIPVGTKFIITDDEGGDEPEPTPTPSGGVNAVNSYLFKNVGDSYTISVKGKIITFTDGYVYIPIRVFYTYGSTGLYTGVGYIVRNDGNLIYIPFWAATSTSKREITEYFNVTIDTDKNEIALTLNEKGSGYEYILII